MSSLKPPAPKKTRRGAEEPAARFDLGDDDDLDLGALPEDQSPGDGPREDSDGEDGRVFSKELALPPVDHAAISYLDVVRDIYMELPRLAASSRAEAANAMREIGVVASGEAELAAPVDRFQDLALSLPSELLGVLLNRFPTPTPVQRALIPNALAGRSVVAIAKTGSGKTVAYSLPLLAHVAAQARRDFSPGSGPSALVLTPTRELATQVTTVLRGFATPLGLNVVCVVGGAGKYAQFKSLRDGRASAAVVTPGRFIDMVRMRACSLARVSFVVVDEADRMVEALGFGPQVSTILSHVRPDAQVLLASATFPPPIHALAARHLPRAHLRLTAAAAAPLVSDTVTEHYITLPAEHARLAWLTAQLPRLLSGGPVLVFGATRGGVAGLSYRLRAAGLPNACVHGDMEPADRRALMRAFRASDVRCLVATDVAGRGIDVPGVAAVVNYEPPRTWEEHVHRAGRTGRAGASGVAYTLLCADVARDVAFARRAVDARRAGGAGLPRELLAVAGRGDRGRGRRRRGRGRGRA